jgi:hypothetical protein
VFCLPVGLVMLCLVYQEWLQAKVKGAAMWPFRARLRNALGIATVMIPVGMVHHLVMHPGRDLVVVSFAALLVAGFGWELRRKAGG